MTTLAGVQHRRLGTDVHLLVTEPELLEAAERVLLIGLAEVDAAASRFRDSELVRACTGEATRISPLLAALVGCALDVAEQTDGLVDPTLGAQLAAAGYDRTFSDLPPDGPSATYLPARGRLDVRLDLRSDGWWLRVPEGVQLDLGATAKAWAADRVASAVAQLGTGALVNLGGDLAVAGPPPVGGWSLDVTDRPGAPPVDTVAVESGGLATSSTTARRWRRGGRELHHVLDPRSGAPAVSTWASVTVAASTCVEANAASTAAVVLGEEALDWLTLPALLVRPTGELVRVGGWP